MLRARSNNMTLDAQLVTRDRVTNVWCTVGLKIARVSR